MIAGREIFEVTQGEITYKGKSLLEMPVEERAREGIFLGFQYPVEIPGVSMANFMRTALNDIRKYRGLEPISGAEFLARMEEKKQLVEIHSKLTNRSVNEGFSGGEKKKNEIFQMAMLEPQLAILDETDSGLDIDALRIVANGVNKLRRPDNATVVITHYQRLLDYIVPDFVHVLYEGRIVKSGGKELALELEEKATNGYEKTLNKRFQEPDSQCRNPAYLSHIDGWKALMTNGGNPATTHPNLPVCVKTRSAASKKRLPRRNPRKLAQYRYREISGPNLGCIYRRPRLSGKRGRFLSCEVAGFDTFLITLYNGWYTYKNAPLRILPNGILVGSLARARREAPELVEAHLGSYTIAGHPFTDLNTAFAHDGFFIYVPDGVKLDKPVQMVNVVNHDQPLFMQTRHLIVVGKNSHVKLVHCDDSHNQLAGFTNSVTEMAVGRDSVVDYYKLQNINDQSILLNNTYIRQESGSACNTFSISLHGGLIRNESFSLLAGPHATANHYGLYLMDKTNRPIISFLWTMPPPTAAAVNSSRASSTTMPGRSSTGIY